MTYAILAYRLMDIAIIIRKTLIYSSVMSILAVCDMSIMTLLSRLFGVHYHTLFASAVTAGSIALFFQPLRRRVQAFVDAKFFREYVDREEKLFELSREVITHITPEAMARSLVRVLGETLHPKFSALYVRSRDGDGFFQLSQAGEAKLPDRMPANGPLPAFFADHPQPFVQESQTRAGAPRDTRSTQQARAA